MPIDPIPLPDSFWLTDSAGHFANAMVAQHWKDVWDLINGAKHLLVTDSGSEDEGSATEQDAYYAAESFTFANKALDYVATTLGTAWSNSGAATWAGPAASTFAKLYNALYYYVGQLRDTAFTYSTAAHDVGWAHQEAKNEWFTYMYDWMYNTSHIQQGIENLVFHPADQFDAHVPPGGPADAYPTWLPIWPPLINFKDGYNWADTTFVMNYNSLHYIGYVAILPGLSSIYGDSYLGLPLAPEPDYPAVDKKDDPYAAEKDNLKKEQDDLKAQQDLFTKQQADAEDAAAAAQKAAQKQAADQEDLLNKQQADAQDQMQSQQKQLSDQAAKQQDDLAKQQDDLAKQQADAQDQMQAQQKQLSDQAAKQQANLDNLPNAPANTGTANVPTPDLTGLTTPGAGGTTPPNSPAVPTGPGAIPAGPSVVTAPDGTLGLDTNGTVTPLPPTAKKVQTPNGTSALDLNGDGIPDTDLNGTAIPGGSGPPGSRLVTGPDGQLGYDVNGDGIADLDLNGNALPGSALPAGSRYVTGPDGRQGFDMTGDGIPDTDPRGIPVPNSPYFSAPPTPPPVTALPPTPVPALNPANQVQMPPPPPGGATAPPGTTAPAVLAGSAAAGAAAAGGGYPPMYPPMGGGMGMGQNQGERNERERQTWLQEEDEVWAGDTAALTALAQMGRPVEDEEAPEEWEVPVRPLPRTAPRQPRPGQFPTGTRR